LAARQDSRAAGVRANHAVRIKIQGVVQGVGFRPHVFRLAGEEGVRGWVLNSKQGVEIHVEGEPDAVDRFVAGLREHPPRMARITQYTVEPATPGGYEEFDIRPSEGEGERRLLISPDVSTCADCLAELADPDDRHYRYPFTNCTNCGPRFTIMRELPYDRPKTTMDAFDMCPDCRAEYEDPHDRRFHAQPVACPACGPRVWLETAGGDRLETGDPIKTAAAFLRRGDILAVKGLGGFHLACDAHSEEAVAALRRRKNRPAKALAVMVRDIEAARRYCRVDPTEGEALLSPQAPILILPRAGTPEGGGRRPVSGLAPGQNTLGLMLPYTPLHHLLLRAEDDLDALVMTSGNKRGHPLITDDDEARRELGHIVDHFLMHDRKIARRCDDSVIRYVPESPQAQERTRAVTYRRSRGFAPYPIHVPGKEGPPVLGTGGEEKNTFCLLEGDQAFASQHIGPMVYEQTVEEYLEGVRDFIDFFEIRPEIIAHDMHPLYRTTQLARDLAREWGMETEAVQHHHAHHAACLAENGFHGKALGFVADGTGYGADGSLWGCELLYGDCGDYVRLASLTPVPLPGGDRAVKFPLRAALGHLLTSLGDGGAEWLMRRFPAHGADLSVARRQVERGLNAPLTSSLGRLFDAVSAVLGLCLEMNYQGQPAVELSEAALVGDRHYPFVLAEPDEDGIRRWQLHELWSALLSDIEEGRDAAEISGAFHLTLTLMLEAAALSARARTGCDVITLSGGVWQNPHLLVHGVGRLRDSGFTVLLPRELPPNDGAISVGQCVVARARSRSRV